MRQIGKKLAAGLCTFTLLCSLCTPVLAAETYSPLTGENSASDSEPETVSEEPKDIRVTVGIFENISRSWILNPMQITCSETDGLQELMDTLVRYAYLEDALVSDGALLSLTDDTGDVYKLDTRKEQSWLLILNGIEYDTLLGSVDENTEAAPFTFSDGDIIQLVFNSNAVAETDMSAVSVPSRTLSTTTEEIPWDAAYDTAITTGSSWLKNSAATPYALTVLGASGTSVDHKYLTRILRGILEEESRDGIALAQDILCVSFSGISAENFSGENLLQTLISLPDLSRLATIGGLLAYDCNGYSVPADALNSRAAMINVIMAGQNEDGGIASQRGETSDILLTALSLTALAPYRDDEAISPCIERALEWLSGELESDGCYYQKGRPSCTATAAAVLALGSLAIPLTDERFSADEATLMDALMRFYQEGSGFSERIGEEPDEYATGLALLALCAEKTERNPLILRSQIVNSGSIDLTSSEESSEEPSSQPVLDEEKRKTVRSGLIGAVLGGGIGIMIMLVVLIRLKKKYGHGKKSADAGPQPPEPKG